MEISKHLENKLTNHTFMVTIPSNEPQKDIAEKLSQLLIPAFPGYAYTYFDDLDESLQQEVKFVESYYKAMSED